MNDEENILFRTVIPFMIWDDDMPYSETGMPFLGKGGTCFFVQFNDEYYAITSKHCLACANPKHIFISLPNKIMKSVPISKIIFSNYKDGLDTDTDVVVMKIPILNTLIEKAKPGANQLVKNILDMPFMKRQIRLNKHRTLQKAISNTIGSSFYKNIKKHQEQNLFKIVEEVYTDDLRFCVFQIKDYHDLKRGDICISVGIPNNDFFIDYTQNTIRSIILETKCEFIEFDTNRQDYVFKCDNVERLDGMSGGPILFKDAVIAVQHSISNGKIYATPITRKFIRDIEKMSA